MHLIITQKRKLFLEEGGFSIKKVGRIVHVRHSKGAGMVRGLWDLMHGVLKDLKDGRELGA